MVARNRPKTNADFLIAPWISQGHSFLRRFSKLDALLDDCAPDACRRRRVLSRNVILDLVKVLLGQRCEQDRQLLHFRGRRRRRFVAGIRGRESASALWIIRLKSSRPAVADSVSCSSSRRSPARITSDLLLNRPLATNRSISRSKCGVMTLLIPLAYSNSFNQLSTSILPNSHEFLAQTNGNGGRVGGIFPGQQHTTPFFSSRLKNFVRDSIPPPHYFCKKLSTGSKWAGILSFDLDLWRGEWSGGVESAEGSYQGERFQTRTFRQI